MKIPDGPRLPFLLQSPYLIARPLEFLEKCARNYGDTFALRFFGPKSPPVVFFSHPQTLQQIFTLEEEKFEWGKLTYVFQPLTGAQSLIMLEGKQHQAMRHVLMPPLHGKQMYAYGEAIVDITKEIIDGWKVDRSICIRDNMCDISLEVILRVVFGFKEGTRYEDFKQLIKPFLAGVSSPLNSVQFFFSFLQQDWGAFSPWGRFVRCRQQIDDLVYAEIADRRDRNTGEDILSLLMMARDSQGSPLSKEVLRDQLMTLLLLGHETIASALSWAFYWVHKQPSVLEKLDRELESLGSDADAIAISKLPYLNAVCNEALRIYPIAIISEPLLVKETIELEGYNYEPGAILVPCIYLAHHRSQTFSEPEKFKPERFIDRKFSSYEYLPFGGGDRICIGKAMSLFEMKLVLATVLSRYRLALSDKHPVKPVRRGVTIIPSGGCQMTVTSLREEIKIQKSKVKIKV